MSKISSHGLLGSNLRKLIDYFCHLSVAPPCVLRHRRNDTAFAETRYLSAISCSRTTRPIYTTPPTPMSFAWRA